ncbi:MAG: hypothetical protein M1823_007652, partial [Watsoniomyces obsoletus]
KQSNWEAKEKSLEEKIENQDRLLKELKASYEVSQRLGPNSDTPSDGVLGKAAAAELDMLNVEFEKTSTRLAEMEARNEQLRIELARATAHSSTSRATEDDADLLRLRSENSSLLRKIETARFDKDAEKRRLDDKLRQVERQRFQLSAEVSELGAKVQKWGDYDEVKRELEVLRSIELSIEDEDDPMERPINGSIDTAKDQSLEQLLLGRNKKLS